MKSLDDGLKQRLVGAIAIFALAVIFLPVLFDRDPIEPVNQSSEIPPPPEIVSIKIDQPVKPEVGDLAPDPETMYEPTLPDHSDPSTANAAAEAPGLNAAGVPMAWVLQVASLKELSRAERLRDSLLEKKFPAFLRKGDSKNGVIYRVYVGPKLDKASLIKEKGKIDAMFNLETVVLEFKP
jgi:DedD protein